VFQFKLKSAWSGINGDERCDDFYCRAVYEL
jgi:hypothetical protein